MERMKLGIVVAAIAGVAMAATSLALYFSATRAPGGKARKVVAIPLDEPPSAVETRQSAPRENLRQPLRRTVLTPATVASLEPDQRANLDDEKVEEDPEASPDSETEADRERLRKEQRASLDGLFDRQQRGGAWSRDTSMSINNALAGVMKPPASILQSVECRETLCRVKVATSDETHYEEAAHALLQARWSFGTGAFFMTRDDAGGRTEGLVMFLAQKDTDLPGVTTR